MPNSYFKFKQFTVHQGHCAMKVSTEACILGAWANAEKPNRILDIGTGTGLLALMLTQRFDCSIDAVELDERAANQARKNILSSPWSDRIQVFHQDIKDFSVESKNRYDLIICNPPFFQSSLKSSISEKNIAKHETAYFNKKLLTDVLNDLLSPLGMAFVIYPQDESEGFQKAVIDNGLFVNDSLIIRNKPDANIFRTISVVSRWEQNIDICELNIREDTIYSEAFKKLMTPYYLKL